MPPADPAPKRTRKPPGTATTTAAKPKRSRAPKRNGDPHKQGRPHDLDRPVEHAGRTLPAADAIIEIMLTGEPLKIAARAVGLNPETAYSWRADGARVWSQLHEGRTTEDQLTAYQAAALAFSNQSSRAEADCEARMAAALGAAAFGGQVRTRTVTEYDGEGNVLLRRVTEEAMPADPKAITFWLERRASERWARTQRVEHALGAEGPTAQTDRRPLDTLAEALQAIERRRDEGRARLATIETTATEAEPEEAAAS